MSLGVLLALIIGSVLLCGCCGVGSFWVFHRHPNDGSVKRDSMADPEGPLDEQGGAFTDEPYDYEFEGYEESEK